MELYKRYRRYITRRCIRQVLKRGASDPRDAHRVYLRKSADFAMWLRERRSYYSGATFSLMAFFRRRHLLDEPLESDWYNERDL